MKFILIYAAGFVVMFIGVIIATLFLFLTWEGISVALRISFIFSIVLALILLGVSLVGVVYSCLMYLYSDDKVNKKLSK